MTVSPSPTQKRPAKPGLLFGIIVFPIVFAWFTLAKGYGPRTRLAAFGWLGVFVVWIALNQWASTAPDPSPTKAVALAPPASSPQPATVSPSAAAKVGTPVAASQEASDAGPDSDAPIDPGNHKTLAEAKAAYERDMVYLRAYAQANTTCVDGRIEIEPLDKSRNAIVEDVTRQCVEYEQRALEAAHTRADAYESERDYVRDRLRDQVG